MVKIGLFCAAGFSTGMLVNNMKIAAQSSGVEAEICTDPKKLDK